ncbi:MAG: tRNA guanosine(34) transglycosylase Tgt [Candidatus Pacearchaeota archaeon]|jgi:queuine tRNA-ribosyltransferase
MIKILKIKGREMNLPGFFPDATVGFVRGVDSEDLVKCHIEGLVVNTYHLLHNDLIEHINSQGGIHNHMAFPGIIISDSGGFQVMSLIRKDSKYGRITDEGAEFILDGKKVFLTPEKCIQLQIKIGSDIIMCLDDCTEPHLPKEEQEKSVKRTIAWAKKCKEEFQKQTRNLSEDKRPLLFGIIQGGNNLELRKKCADALKEINFDGYAFGGWPIDENKEFLGDLLEYTCKLMPENKLKYAMGIGKPENIVACTKMGYDMFDCVIPTREARNNRLYAFKKGLIGLKKLSSKNNFYKYVRVRNGEYINDKNPISKYCDSICCKNYSCADIYNLFKKKDRLSIKLATMHNLRFYTMLMDRLR